MKYKAALIIIGDEILSGRTQDTNLSYIALWLNKRGVQLAETRVIPDEKNDFVYYTLCPHHQVSSTD